MYKIYKKKLTRNFLAHDSLIHQSFLWQPNCITMLGYLGEAKTESTDLEYLLTSNTFVSIFVIIFTSLYCNDMFSFQGIFEYTGSQFEDGTMFCQLYLWWMVLHSFFQQIGLRQQVLAIWLGLHRNVGIGGGVTQLSAYNVSQERVQNGQQKALVHATWYPRFLSVLSSCQRRKSNRSTSYCAFFLSLASTVNLRFKLAHASIFIYRRKRCPTL